MKFVLFFILFPILGFSQTNEERLYSVKYGLGLGIYDGKKEVGVGLLGSFGIQKTFGEKKKLRLNPNLTIGRFSDFTLLHTPNQKFTYFSLDFLAHYDLIKYKAFSIVTSAGGYLCLTSGKIEDYYYEDRFFISGGKFTHPYLMASVSGSLRIAPKRSRYAVDLTFLKIQLGTSYSFLGEFKISVDYKINK